MNVIGNLCNVNVVGNFSNVSFRIPADLVPSSEPGLHFVDKAIDPDGIEIPSYFHRGIPIKTPGRSLRILNCHFYGVGLDDLGRKTNFDIEVLEKTVGAKTYTLVDFYKADSQSESNFKINMGKQSLGGDVKICGTDAFIRIVPRKKMTDAEFENFLLSVYSEADLDREIDELSKSLQAEHAERMMA